jgi:putative multicomponent Na+:H+ antiporter subunit B
VLELLVMLIMAVFALLTIHTKQLRLAIIYLAVFSLLAALLYLLFAAPELAIAEAVIGSGLVSLLYLAALKRNRVYTIGVVVLPPPEKLTDDIHNAVEQSRALHEVRRFFVRREVEVQLVFTELSVAEARANLLFDLVLSWDGQAVTAHTDDNNYIAVELEMMFQLHDADNLIRFERSVGGLET